MKTKLSLFFVVLIISQNIFSQEPTVTTNISELEETGNFQEALIQVKKLLETDSLNENLWVKAAQLYCSKQQYKLSIAAYEKAFKIIPSNHKYLLFLAKSNKLAGNKDLSIKLYKDFLQFEPFNIMALSELATNYILGNQTDSAAATYKKLYLLDTSNVDYLQKWASNQWASGQTIEAFINFKKAYKMDSTYLPVVFDLAKIYVNKKRQDSAIAILKMNIIVSPIENRLYADLGTAFFSKGDYTQAIPEYEKAIEFGYKGTEAFKRLGISYYSVAKYDKSKQMLELLIVKDTADYKVCLYLGNIYNYYNKPEKAIVFLNKAIVLLLPDPLVVSAVYTSLIDSYRATHDYKELINVLVKRNDNMPQHYRSPEYLYEIANVYEDDLKNKEKALFYYQEYYKVIKDLTYNQEIKVNVLSKINALNAIK